MWLTIAWQSLLNRRFSVLLTFVALMISVSLLFSIEHIRVQTQENFKRTVSGVDLVVAARSSQINVLLSSVFRMGANPTALSWDVYESVSANEQVVWSIPLSLGDSYQGFPVVGTTVEYFEHFKYGKKQNLGLQHGRFFRAPLEIVVGASVAKELGLQIGHQLVISHGFGKVSFSHHTDHPFTVSGILQATGTPVDKSLHVPLIAIDKMHKPAAPRSLSRPKTISKATDEHEHEHEHEHDHSSHEHNASSLTKVDLPDVQEGQYNLTGNPKNISAFLLKLDSPFTILTMQRDLNNRKDEAVSAILPALALAELWKIIGSVETVLQLIALLVLCSSLIGLITLLLASMHERKAEITVLRAIGASPWYIASLIQAEALMISLFSLVGAYILVTLCLVALGDWLLLEYGIFISTNIYSNSIILYAALVVGLTALVALLPSVLAYKNARQLFQS